MQEQIGGNHIDISGIILLKKLEDVRRDRFDSPPNCIEIPLCFGAHDLVPIEQDHGEPLPPRSQSPRDPQHEGAIAGTKIEYSSRSLLQWLARTPAMIPACCIQALIRRRSRRDRPARGSSGGSESSHSGRTARATLHISAVSKTFPHLAEQRMTRPR